MTTTTATTAPASTTPTPTATPPGGPGAPSALERAAGVAGYVEAATYLVGFGVLAAYLLPEGYADVVGDPAASMAFVVEHQTVLSLWTVTIYLVAGAALTVLAIGLHRRLRRSGSELAGPAAAFGLIWSGLVLAAGMVGLVGQQAAVDLYATDPDRAATVWTAVDAVQEGLGGGIELVGGLWALTLGWAGLRSGVLGRGLSRLALVVGAAGVATVVPVLAAPAGAVFGLGFIVWFVGAGRSLRTPAAPPA